MKQFNETKFATKTPIRLQLREGGATVSRDEKKSLRYCCDAPEGEKRGLQGELGNPQGGHLEESPWPNARGSLMGLGDERWTRPVHPGNGR